MIAPGDSANPGCQKWDGNHNCLECSVRYYFNQERVCTPISDNCRTWNQETGACQTCYQGHVVNDNGECIVDPNPFIPAANSLCKTWDGTRCLECSYRAYFNSENVCTPISDNCNTWDLATGNCLTCYHGFILVDGRCELAPGVTPSDLGCKIWDWQNQVCLTCSKNWVFNTNNVCTPVSDRCREHDENGLCTSCYFGYDLEAGSCIISPSNNR